MSLCPYEFRGHLIGLRQFRDLTRALLDLLIQCPLRGSPPPRLIFCFGLPASFLVFASPGSPSRFCILSRGACVGAGRWPLGVYAESRQRRPRSRLLNRVLLNLLRAALGRDCRR